MKVQIATIPARPRMMFASAAGVQAEPDASEADPSSPPGRWQPLSSRPPRTQRRYRWLIRAMALLLSLLALALAFWRIPWSTHGSLVDVQHGEVEVRLDSSGSWKPLAQGDTIRQGTTLRAAPDTLATLALFDRGLMRIESGGEWTVNTLQRSRDGHISRIHLYQHHGQASYSAAMAGDGVRAVCQIDVPGATLDLVGVAIVTTSEEHTRMQVLQGRALITSPDEYIVATTGQTTLIRPAGPITILEAP
ncbi:MAG TPA: hypothetical protein GX702_15555 [Chloroflexi bacterium]|nr:hypothetical protein [Chloroflexota bacterium]